MVSCGGTKVTRPEPAPPSANKPAGTTDTDAVKETANKPGGYYLDDGPEANPPTNLDSIPDAVPKKEPLLPRLNKPYVALGQTYQPMTVSQPYKMRGVASWYGKRFHGKKTSNGETYDMYAMTAAHAVLPLPSYARVTNVANGRSVVVRINDRGPFKKDRIIDLSYAAAYKLRLIAQGSGLVEVEAINQNDLKNVNAVANNDSAVRLEGEDVTTSADAANTSTSTDTSAMPMLDKTLTQPEVNATRMQAPPAQPVEQMTDTKDYFVQAGAFKNESNAENLMKRIQDMGIAPNIGINRVYNNALHRLKLGPFSGKLEAEQLAAQLRKQLNIPAIILNQ